MNGMILAAGYGTRLHPLTAERPKAAVPVANVAAAAWAARSLARAGIVRVAVNLHHLPGEMERALGDGSDLGIEIAYSREEGGILGTGGGIRLALEHLGTKPIVVVNGDVISDLDLTELVRAHERSGAPVTMALTVRPDHARYGTVTALGGSVISIAGHRGPATVARAHDEVQAVFTGISVLGPEVQPLLPPTGCLVRETFFTMLDRGIPIAAHVHAGFWNDIGTPAEYLRCNLDILNGRAGVLPPPRGVEDSRLLGENVSIGRGARLGPDVILGDGARVMDGADLEACVVWDGARAAGRLRRAVVGRGHTVLVEEDA